MNAREAQRLIETISALVDEGPKDTKPVKADKSQPSVTEKVRQELRGEHVDVARTKGTASTLDGEVATKFDNPATEALYQAFKLRFIEEAKIDPILLHLIMSRPELVVEVEPKVMRLDEGSTKGRIGKLLARGFFADIKAAGAVRKELARTGSDPGSGGTLYNPLTDLVRDGFLTKEGDGFRIAPGVKVSERQLETAGVDD